MFSSEPPVFARPKNAPLVQPAVQQPAIVQPAVAQAAYATSAYTYQAEAIATQTAAAAAASTKSPRQQLIENVTMKLQEELVKLDSGIRRKCCVLRRVLWSRKTCPLTSGVLVFFHASSCHLADDIDLEVENQAKLQQAQSTISAELAALRMTKERLLKAVDTLPQRREALRKWHEEASQAEASENVEDLIVPLDIPSRQYVRCVCCLRLRHSAHLILFHVHTRLLEAMAEYHAIEDTLYYLDRAIAAGNPNLNLDSFLRVRIAAVRCVCISEIAG